MDLFRVANPHVADQASHSPRLQLTVLQSHLISRASFSGGCGQVCGRPLQSGLNTSTAVSTEFDNGVISWATEYRVSVAIIYNLLSPQQSSPFLEILVFLRTGISQRTIIFTYFSTLRQFSISSKRPKTWWTVLNFKPLYKCLFQCKRWRMVATKYFFRLPSMFLVLVPTPQVVDQEDHKAHSQLTVLHLQFVVCCSVCGGCGQDWGRPSHFNFCAVV